MWPFKGKAPEQKLVAKQRKFAASQLSNLLADWVTVKEEIDNDIRSGGQRLLSRARDAAKNNDYARRYLNMLKTGVIGQGGIRLQVRSKNRKGELDTAANDRVEAAWKLYGKSVDVTGTLTMIDLQNLIMQSAARDGEILIREVVGFPNAFGYAVQVFDNAQLDYHYSEELKNGNTIRLSVEFDKWDRPVAYHLTQSSKISGGYVSQGKHRIRIPAAEIIHTFRPEFANQSRGFSWMSAALVEMHHLAHFQEAALIRARLGASTMGIYYEENPGDVGADWKAADGSLFQDAEPGTFRKLPAGARLEVFDPSFPADMVDGYVKRSLMSIASGLNVGYSGLASDPESTSYGTLRAFTIDERDYYRTLQNWIAESILDRIYNSWIKQALLNGQIGLPASTLDKLVDVRWQGRGWHWIDPAKDAVAYEKLDAMQMIDEFAIAAERGVDLEDVYRNRAEAKKLRQKYGLIEEAQNA